MSRPTPTAYKTRNWPEYNKALKRRGSLTIWFDPAMTWEAAPTGKRGRQPDYSDAAIQTCLTGLETAKKVGDLGFQSRLYANLAVAYCALTNRCDDQGVGAAEAAVALDRRLGQVDHLAVPLIVLGQIHQCHGAPDAALRYYQEALGVAEEVGDPQLLFPCYDGLATLYLDLGQEAEAERYMQKAQAVCERAGLEPDSLVVLPFLS